MRFTSTDDSPLQWQAGAYYLDYQRHYEAGNFRFPYGFCFFLDPSCNPNPDDPIPFPRLTNHPPEDTVVVVVPFENSDRGREQIAGYANVSYRFNNVEIAGGVRVDHWKSDADQLFCDSGTTLRKAVQDTEVLGPCVP